MVGVNWLQRLSGGPARGHPQRLQVSLLDPQPSLQPGVPMVLQPTTHGGGQFQRTCPSGTCTSFTQAPSLGGPGIKMGAPTQFCSLWVTVH